MEFSLKILDQDSNVIAVSSGEDEVFLLYEQEYDEGDQIVLEISEAGSYVWLQMDDAIGRSLVYLTGNVTYQIPFGDKRLNLSPKAFQGAKHLLSVRRAKEYEWDQYQNLALNRSDQHELKNCYPHATANVETRGESVFAAQNAIDGITTNHSHGEWPYESWGINMQDDAKIRIEFGRKVWIDRIILYTRADFPHDNWWRQVSFTFSDDSECEMRMEKSEKPHEIIFSSRNVTWVEMHDMKKSEEPSPFPALTQIEVYGRPC